MAPRGIPRTPQRDAARQRWRAPAARAFSTVSQLIDIHRLAHALCGSGSAPWSSLRVLSLAWISRPVRRPPSENPNYRIAARQASNSFASRFRREPSASSVSESGRVCSKLAPAMPRGVDRRLRPVRREELRPESLEAPCATAGIALSFRYQPGTTTSTILFQLDIHARSRCLGCGEIAKGIDDDVQSARVR